MVDCFNNYTITVADDETATAESINTMWQNANTLKADALFVRLLGKACGLVQLFQQNGFYVRDWVEDGGGYLELVRVVKGEVPPRRTASVGVSCMVTDGSGNVLVVKERKGTVRLFKFVTGFVHVGETPEHAARREVGEELGVAAQSCELYGSFQCSVSKSVDDYWHLYNVTIEKDATITLQTDELVEYRWVSASLAHDDKSLTAFTTAMVVHYLCGSPLPIPLMRGPKQVAVIYSK